MSLTNVRTRFRFSLTSLLRRPATAEAPHIWDGRWLTQRETAQILQPYMPSRNALAWLEVDRNMDPSLPFFVQQGKVIYRLGDVRAFIRRMPKTNLGGFAAHVAEREVSDRRDGKDRRSGEYVNVVEERRRLIDRRSGFERREGFDRRQTRDDFGYGRNGDRRGLAGKA